MEKKITYLNTSDNASTVGWNRVPEYCVRDGTVDKVGRDDNNGRGVLHNTDESDINILLEAFRL